MTDFPSLPAMAAAAPPETETVVLSEVEVRPLLTKLLVTALNWGDDLQAGTPPSSCEPVTATEAGSSFVSVLNTVTALPFPLTRRPPLSWTVRSGESMN